MVIFYILFTSIFISSIVYFSVLGQWLNIPLERIPYCLKCTVGYWSVSNSFKWDIQSLTRYSKVNYTGNVGNNMVKFIYYQILVNTSYIDIKVEIECVTHMPPQSTHKATHSGIETQRRHHQKSKTRVLVSVVPQKGLMPSKIFFKKLK